MYAAPTARTQFTSLGLGNAAQTQLVENHRGYVEILLHLIEKGKVLDQVIRWRIAQNPDLNSNIAQWSNTNFLNLKTTLKNCMSYIRYFQITGEDVMYKQYPYQQIFESNLWKDIMSKLAAPNRAVTSIILPSRIISNTVLPSRNSAVLSGNNTSATSSETNTINLNLSAQRKHNEI
ncbi:hypothetical protein C2G38_2159146 [Gigaspora rosea]|uniref:Uncharacterized protein n=1 Tax=Gigaspora rosea TaxID=44941 RepID=A0A397W6Q3_9GLOM|nr:hypothetical protein C2G38_2159146 [Gigaspora rosea]